MTEECIFCNIPEERVEKETTNFFLIRDLYPVTHLHTLVIPKRHIESYFELNSEELKELSTILNDLKIDLETLDRAITGFNIGINIGEDAGQTIFHCHIHVIPRRKNDTKNPKGGVRGVIPDKKDYVENRSSEEEIIPNFFQAREPFYEITDYIEGKGNVHIIDLFPDFKKISFLEICKIVYYNKITFGFCPCPACSKIPRHLLMLLIYKDKIIEKLRINPNFRTNFIGYNLEEKRINKVHARFLQNEIIKINLKKVFNNKTFKEQELLNISRVRPHYNDNHFDSNNLGKVYYNFFAEVCIAIRHTKVENENNLFKEHILKHFKVIFPRAENNLFKLESMPYVSNEDFYPEIILEIIKEHMSNSN